MRELTSTTAAEAAQIAAGEGSALGNDVWRRACAAGSLSEAAWKVLDGEEPLLHRDSHEQAHGSRSHPNPNPNPNRNPNPTPPLPHPYP